MSGDKESQNKVDERLLQFERNRYFYGKLMTASDFESEQQYVNSKRHLINRLVHGSGIICGLQVSAFQNKALSVTLSSGVALDCMGQEVIVSKNNETHEISTKKLHPNSSQEKQYRFVGIFMRRQDEGKEPVPSPSSTDEKVCTDNKIQENFELYFDTLQEYLPEISNISLDEKIESLSEESNSLEKSNIVFQEDKMSHGECPSCGGKGTGILVGVIKKSSSGWEIDPVETIQRRKTIETWFNHMGEFTSDKPGKSENNSTSGIIEIEYLAGTNLLFGPIDHYLNNTSVPPLITLGKAADNANVEYVEDYGLCENKTPPICFKSVNINPKNFMIRLDAKSPGKISLRWWATATRDTGWQEIKAVVRPTMQFSSSKYSFDDLPTLTITDPSSDKPAQVNYVSVKISSKNNQQQSVKLQAQEIGPSSGVFNAKIPTSDIIRKTPDTLIASYSYTVQGRTDTITATAEVTKSEKPKISFSSRSFTLYDNATIRIIDNAKGPTDVLSVQVSSMKNPVPIHVNAPYVITSNLFGVLFNAKINVVTVTKAVPDTIIASYRYKVGNEIKTLTAKAEITETR